MVENHFMQLFDAIDGNFNYIEATNEWNLNPFCGEQQQWGSSPRELREWTNVCHTKLWS